MNGLKNRTQPQLPSGAAKTPPQKMRPAFFLTIMFKNPVGKEGRKKGGQNRQVQNRIHRLFRSFTALKLGGQSDYKIPPRLQNRIERGSGVKRFPVGLVGQVVDVCGKRPDPAGKA